MILASGSRLEISRNGIFHSSGPLEEACFSKPELVIVTVTDVLGPGILSSGNVHETDEGIKCHCFGVTFGMMGPASLICRPFRSTDSGTFLSTTPVSCAAVMDWMARPKDKRLKRSNISGTLCAVSWTLTTLSTMIQGSGFRS